MINNERSDMGSNKKMKSTIKGPSILLFLKVVQLWKQEKMKQSSIDDVFDK